MGINKSKREEGVSGNVRCSSEGIEREEIRDSDSLEV